jgi:acyl-CoA thioesterase YciA
MDAQPTGQLTVRIVAMPADTNPSGDIFGGWIMAQMDLSAGVAGRERARGRVVTASVSSLSFLQPVKVGDVVAVYTEVVGTGRTSIRIQIEAWVNRSVGSAQLKVTEALFVMVAVDEAGSPAPLPPA